MTTPADQPDRSPFRHATYCATLVRNEPCDCPLSRIAELERAILAARAALPVPVLRDPGCKRVAEALDAVKVDQ